MVRNPRGADRWSHCYAQKGQTKERLCHQTMALALPREARGLDWLACPVGAKAIEGIQPKNGQPCRPWQRGEADTRPLYFCHLLISHQCLPLAKLSPAGNQLALELGKCSLGSRVRGRMRRGTWGSTDPGSSYISYHTRTSMTFKCQIH